MVWPGVLSGSYMKPGYKSRCDKMKGSANTIIMVFVTMLVGASLILPFALITDDVTANTTGSVSTMTSLLPVLFVIVIVALAVSYIKFGKK